MTSIRKTGFVSLIAAFAIVLPSLESTAGVINGDFSHPTALFGFTPTGTVISEPTGEFAQFETDGTPSRTLAQTFDIPTLPTVFSFTFAFSTASGLANAPQFPDSFAASLETADGDFLDLFVVDVFGPLPDPSHGFESFPGFESYVPIDVALDSSVSIAGFSGISGGTEYSGRVSLALPNDVLGDSATIVFELLNNDDIPLDNDPFKSIAAVDDITLSSNPVPEPGSAAYMAVLLLSVCLRYRRQSDRKRRC